MSVFTRQNEVNGLFGAMGASGKPALALGPSPSHPLKRKRIRRIKYKTREEAQQDVFDQIEIYYNPQRKHVRNGMLSPIDFEQQLKLKLQGV